MPYSPRTRAEIPKTANSICIVTAGGPYAWIIVNALTKHFGALNVVQEQPEAMGIFLKRRARKQGWLSVSGQVITMALTKFGKKAFAGRITRIIEQEGLDPEPHQGQTIIDITSINSRAFIDAIQSLKPHVVLLVGTRILKAEYLDQIHCPVLNYHAGITPQYRGMNGGYWALATGDTDNFGATIHLVDSGIDTGRILKQVRGAPAPDDTIGTYAHRLAALSRGICIEAINDALDNRLAPVTSDAPSRQWYHPPIWRYFWTGLSKGVW
jgi:methionyl-tRNA formyltransferase